MPPFLHCLVNVTYDNRLVRSRSNLDVDVLLLLALLRGFSSFCFSSFGRHSKSPVVCNLILKDQINLCQVLTKN